jgi:AraC-like DNA-binding protein
MRGQTTSAKAGNAADTALHLTNTFTTVRPVSPTRTTPGERLLRSKYRELTQKHLGRLLDKLFAEFTGLHFHIAWSPAASRNWDSRSLPTGCSVCCRIAGTRLAAQPTCQVCGRKQLVRALATDGEGLSFRCRLRVLNHWFPLRVRDVTIGIAYLQAFDGTQPGKPRRTQSARAAATVSSQSEFRRASRLLRLIVQHVQTLDLAELRKAELTTAGRAVVALEKEQARLHEALQRHLPGSPQVPLRAEAESHPEQIVRELTACIEQDYATPITLQRCADKMRMNAAYLSALFSRAVGRSFKTHLTELRMEKAKPLLRDPAKNVSEVASAVGYASENRFRLAFKKATGLAPKLWRETMRMNPSKPAT